MFCGCKKKVFMANKASSMERTLSTEQPTSIQETTRMSEPPTTSTAYPSVLPLSSDLATKNFKLPQICIETEPTACGPQLYPDIGAEATAIPSRAKLLQMSSPSEAELLSEQELLEYYQNEQLEFVEDFVDVFIQQEIEPRHSLYELLDAYRDVCERIQHTGDLKNATVEQLHRVNNLVWTVSERRIVHQGKCGCERSASGESSYKTAQMHPEQLIALKEALDTLSEYELDAGGFCGEVHARSLALQIQWTVVTACTRFFTEHQLQTGSHPLLLNNPPTPSKPSRQVLRGALSDLFHFLRYPMLPNRFRDSLVSWIVELASVLLKACTTDDQCFLLCHLLRTPSPIGQWGAQLVQTFITVPGLEQRQAMDSFMALLGMLMQPIRHRDRFLVRLTTFYDGDNAWNLVSEDGDMDNANLSDLTEADLIELFSQFPIRPLLNVAFRQFTLLHQGHRLLVLYSLVAFVLILLKILDEGLQTYGTQKNMSKKIADTISKIIHYFCAYWELSRGDLADSDRVLVQNEVNRIVLQAVYYISSKKNAAIRQFLVDFPYAMVSEQCRLRCQLLLRSPPNRQAPNVRALYEIPETELIQRVKNAGHFVNNMGGTIRESDDLTYTVSALASIVSRSEQELHHFVTELIDICFLNENSRDDFYKVGSEAMAVLIERNPSLLSAVLRYIDRHVDHLDEYAVNILANVPLQLCTVSADDISDRLGKWLINRPVNHPASVIARRVLSSLNWNCNSGEMSSAPSKSSYSDNEGKDVTSTVSLWIPAAVHDICAEMLVKAHIVQCKQRNSLISKSMNKAARLATKCPDLEQQFDKFCWDVLLRLKISEKPDAPSPPNDLTAFYVYCIQKCLSSPNTFLDTGLRYFQELINASCFNAAAVLLARLVYAFHSDNRIKLFTANPTFCECLDRLLHADESAYAVQLLMGADRFPGPVLCLIASSIIHQICTDAATSFDERQQFARAWLRLLTCPKRAAGYEWNTDKCVLHLLGCVSKCGMQFDPQGMFGMVELLRDMHKAQYQAWRDSGRGPLSWFSSSTVHPPLITSNLFTVSPWAAYLLLRAEQITFPEFFVHLNEAIGKHQNRSLEESLKKACSRSHLQLSVDRLPFYRWAQFCCTDGICGTKTHSAFPLALQQLALSMFGRKKHENRPLCLGWRFLHCKEAEPLFSKLRTEVLPRAIARQQSSTSEDGESQIPIAPARGNLLANAVGQWLLTEKCYRPELEQYGYADQPMDYLLQMIITGDEHIWTEFIDQEQLKRENTQRSRQYGQLCHRADWSLPSSPQLAQQRRRFPQYNNLTQLFTALDASPNAQKSDWQPFPTVPVHRTLPMPDRLDLGPSFDPFGAGIAASPTVAKFGTSLEELGKAAKAFLSTREHVDAHNGKYLEHFQSLYKQIQQQQQVALRCGNILTSRCPKPAMVQITVTLSEYDQEIAAKMNENRREREEALAQLLAQTDALAITSARLEHTCSELSILASSDSNGKAALMISSNSQQLLQIGLKLFYRICSSIQGAQLLLFPAGMKTFEACLNKLGQAFVAKNPAEQLALMRIVLAGNPLNHLLVNHFTPHCVQPPALLAQLYAELSASVRQPSTSEAALALLRRLDIEHAGRQLPANQFQALMPVMFENLASVTSSLGSTIASPLRDLCMEHFVHAMFHRFPHNIVDGLRLVLNGCDKQCIPAPIFAELAKRLKVDTLLIEDYSNRRSTPPNKNGIELSTEKAQECFQVIANQLSASRRELASRLFTLWAPYLDQICMLADFFLRSHVQGIFRADASTSAMENELNKAFRNAQSCWAPLLEPVPISNIAPWSANDGQLALSVLDRLIRHLLWLPYTLYIPPGSEAPEALFWQYFASTLVGDGLRNGAQANGSGLKHIYSVYENKLTALNWARFWPTLMDLDRMDQLLLPTNGPSTSQSNNTMAQIIAEILVRLPWPQLIQQYQQGYQPEQARREFHSLLLTIFGKCILRREHYTRSRASMSSLLKLLHDNCLWAYTKAEVVDRVGTLLAEAFPSSEEWFGQSRLDESQQCWQSIWRQACHFSTISITLPQNIPDTELAIPRKRALYFRTQLRLLFRSSSGVELAEQLRHYAELLDRANFVLTTAADRADYLDMAKEFVAIWTYQQDLANLHRNKKGRAVVEALHARMAEWLTDHPDSPLVLLLASTTMAALHGAPFDVHRQFGLGLLDTCVEVYFKRNVSGEWREISQWVRVPNSAESMLYVTPKSDSNNTIVEPHFLTLNAHLMRELAATGDSGQELLKLTKKLGDFLASIKPKYMNNEPAFLLCTEKWQRLCIRLFSTPGVSLLHANEQLETYLQWLHRVHAEEGKTGGFLSMVTSKLARRPTYSTRLQLFSNVLYLYISQQQIAANQPPRLRAGTPVLNSRGSAFRELRDQKSLQEYADVLAEVAPFFTGPDHCLTDTEELFQRLVHLIYPTERVSRKFDRSIKNPFRTLLLQFTDQTRVY